MSVRGDPGQIVPLLASASALGPLQDSNAGEIDMPRLTRAGVQAAEASGTAQTTTQAE